MATDQAVLCAWQYCYCQAIAFNLLSPTNDEKRTSKDMLHTPQGQCSTIATRQTIAIWQFSTYLKLSLGCITMLDLGILMHQVCFDTQNDEEYSKEMYYLTNKSCFRVVHATLWSTVGFIWVSCSQMWWPIHPSILSKWWFVADSVSSSMIENILQQNMLLRHVKECVHGRV